MKARMKSGLALVLAFFAIAVSAEGLNIIPKPMKAVKGNGTFSFQKSTEVLYEKGNDDAEALAELVAEELSKSFGFALETDSFGKGFFFNDKLSDSYVLFTSKDADKKLNAEGYTLDITKEGITVKASTYAGLFYGYMTIRQLLPYQVDAVKVAKNTKWTVPVCSVVDQPRMAWRGMHLDESRHFFGVESVKQYIDFIAMHKMNKFHWHLIDDGGWRLEIKKYPRLTEVGAWRNTESAGWGSSKITWPRAKDPKAENVYGGFYTQEEVKEIVAYASKRNVDVVPEIEMPGHIMPVLAAYPELGSHPEGGFYSWTRLPEGMDLETFKKRGWGYQHQNVADVGKPEATEFFKNVLDEVFTLFPSKYLHIGGDEVQKHYWENSPWVKKLMEKEKLHDQHEVQAHFLKEMGKYITANGRKMVGWDEIVDGGLAPNATVMYWIGGGRMRKALEAGHDVVMSPTGPCYFDYGYQGNSVEKVYTWKVMPDNLTPEQEKNVVGAQANVWTEWMRDWPRVQNRVMPRMISLAENLWTPKADQNLADYLTRLDDYYNRLDAMDVNYYVPAPRAVRDAVIFKKGEKAVLELVQPKTKGMKIHYTLDGSKPTKDSKVYTGPITVKKTTTLKAVMVAGDKVSETVLQVSAKQFAQPKVGSLVQGLDYQYAEGEWKKVPTNFNKLENVTKGKINNFDLSVRKRGDHFAVQYDGFIKLEKDGLYEFATGSDDGSYLAIAGARVVDNDGLHGYAIKKGLVDLKAGIYPVTVGFVEAGGAETLDVFVTAPGEKEVKISDKVLFRNK